MAASGKGKLEQALRWIEDNWVGEKSCAICGHSGWFIGETIGEMKQINPGSRWIPNSGSAYPLIVLSCENCGYTLLFNAMVLGIMDG